MSCLEGHRHTVQCDGWLCSLCSALSSSVVVGFNAWRRASDDEDEVGDGRREMRKTGSWKVLYILASRRRRMDRVIVLTEHCIVQPERQSIHVGLVVVADFVGDTYERSDPTYLHILVDNFCLLARTHTYFIFIPRAPLLNENATGREVR